MPFAYGLSSSMADCVVGVEVVYALPDRQVLLAVSIPVGSTARDAVLRSGIQQHFPGLDLQSMPLGLFGKSLAKPEVHILEEGDRVEIYRPLLVDPKEIRKQRAAKARARIELGE